MSYAGYFAITNRALQRLTEVGRFHSEGGPEYWDIPPHIWFTKKMWTPIYSPHLSTDDRQAKGTISFKSSMNQSWDLWGVYFLSLVNLFSFLGLKETPLGWWFQCEGIFYTTPAGYALAVSILSLTNMGNLSSLSNIPSSIKGPNTRCLDVWYKVFSSVDNVAVAGGGGEGVLDEFAQPTGNLSLSLRSVLSSSFPVSQASDFI